MRQNEYHVSRHLFLSWPKKAILKEDRSLGLQAIEVFIVGSVAQFPSSARWTMASYSTVSEKRYGFVDKTASNSTVSAVASATAPLEICPEFAV